MMKECKGCGNENPGHKCEYCQTVYFTEKPSATFGQFQQVMNEQRQQFDCRPGTVTRLNGLGGISGALGGLFR